MQRENKNKIQYHRHFTMALSLMAKHKGTTLLTSVEFPSTDSEVDRKYIYSGLPK